MVFVFMLVYVVCLILVFIACLLYCSKDLVFVLVLGSGRLGSIKLFRV